MIWRCDNDDMLREQYIIIKIIYYEDNTFIIIAFAVC